VNDLGLHHQYLARRVATVEDALHEGEAYLLATQLHRSRVNSHQVTVDPSEDHCESQLPAHVAAAAADSLLPSEVTHMTEMVEKLVAALVQSAAVGPAQRPQRSGAGAATTTGCHLLGMWQLWAPPQGVPLDAEGVEVSRPAGVSSNRGLGTKLPPRGSRQQSVWTRRAAHQSGKYQEGQASHTASLIPSLCHSKTASASCKSQSVMTRADKT